MGNVAYQKGQTIWVQKLITKAKNRKWQHGTVHHFKKDKSWEAVDVMTIKLDGHREGDRYLKLVADGDTTRWRQYLRATDYLVSETPPQKPNQGKL